MTSEIAVMNKLGVALAADSIVTITSARGQKTYNTTNKLFTLSKKHPVGILTNNLTEVNKMPIEIIIKEFREKLGEKSYKTIKEYSDKFIEFLKAIIPLNDEVDKMNLDLIAGDHADTLAWDFRRECKAKAISLVNVTLFTPEMEAALNSVIKRFNDHSSSEGRLPVLSSYSPSDLFKKYTGIIEECVVANFKKYPISDNAKIELSEAVANRILSNAVGSYSCGLVIAGYGDDEFYPAIIEHETEGKIFGELKVISTSVTKITEEHESDIWTFAQRDAAESFLNGVDSGYQKFIDESIEKLLPGLADISGSYFSVVDQSLIDNFKKVLTDTASKFVNMMEKRRRSQFTQKLHKAVEMLDKSELAALAENLVGLVALKQKVSTELETVGGPIDVAIISKHDGFVWIKRKHYFLSNLNPFFFENYLKFYRNESN